MNLLQRIRGLDAEVGISPNPGEKPEAYLRRIYAGRRRPGSRLVGAVLVDALDRIALLEAKVERLEGAAGTREG